VKERLNDPDMLVTNDVKTKYMVVCVSVCL
jgi:hypothetical protein